MTSESWRVVFVWFMAIIVVFLCLQAWSANMDPKVVKVHGYECVRQRGFIRDIECWKANPPPSKFIQYRRDVQTCVATARDSVDMETCIKAISR